MLMIIFEVILGLFACVSAAFINLIKDLFPESFAKKVDDDIVFLTGGGSGIGRLIALKLAKLGATIVTVDVNQVGNEETVRMIQKEGGKAYGFVCDLSNKEAIHTVSRNVVNQVGNITILINNAGIVSGTSLLDTSDEKIIRTMNVNVLAHFWTIKEFLPEMINAQKGHIVTIASIAGTGGTNKLVDYCASKFANVGMDDAIKVELMVQGLDNCIHTTVVCPYYISTGMFAGVQSKFVPIQEPEFVADTIVTGILINKPMIMIPWWSKYLLVFKAVLPTKPFMKISQSLGFNCSMDQFEGRAIENNGKIR